VTEPCASSFVRATPPDWLDEPERSAVPEGVDVIDAHVHLFPPRVFHAIWRWFDDHAWNIRYRLEAEQVIEHLSSRGVSKICGLHYSHKPGMAEPLNDFVLGLAKSHPQVLPFATVLPGEPGARDIVRKALRAGARGVKLHCHVQKLPADDPRLDEVYAECSDAGRPVVIHAGREPNLGGYGVDVRALCGADQVARVLERHPRLRLVVPHLGADEYDAYSDLLDRFENLWLDTTMVIAGYFTKEPPASLFPGRPERLLYGTDFPNIPYAWNRELDRVLTLDPAARRKVLHDNAAFLFD
jgi:hypothetical protein